MNRQTHVSNSFLLSWYQTLCVACVLLRVVLTGVKSLTGETHRTQQAEHSNMSKSPNRA